MTAENLSGYFCHVVFVCCLVRWPANTK